MQGIIISDIERQEMEYLIKRELDELLYDFQDERSEGIVKRAMEERYKILFRLFSKVANPTTCKSYLRSRKY